jgi:hypothetical protein
VIKHTIARILTTGGVASSVLFAGAASAIDWNITGFVREEISYSITSADNPNNTMTRPFANRITPNITNATFNAGNAAASTSIFTNTTGGPAGGLFASTALNAGGFLPAGAFTSASAGCFFGHENAIAAGSVGFGGSGTLRGSLCPNGAGSLQPGNAPLAAVVDPAAGQGFSAQADMLGVTDDINFNTFNSRAEVDVQARFNKNWSAYMKVRAYFDGTRHLSDGKFGDHYANPFYGDRRATVTEFNSPDAIIDIPALYVDWNQGPLWIRAGNQVIAWGEAYFFRVADVANGLDLRRHLVLGPGAEEYQDQRIASPGVRVSYTFKNDWEIDAFAQMFSPSILPGQNTPYNLVPTSVYVEEEDGFDDAEGAMNYGFRLTMPFTESFTGLVSFVSRRNPDGVFTSTDAPTFWRGKPNPFCLGANNDTNNLLASAAVFGADPTPILPTLGVPAMPTLNTAARTMENGCGTAYGVDPYAASSIDFWSQISAGRLDAGQYAIKTIEEWPASNWATREIFGFGRENTFAELYRTLEGFRSSFGGITQWVGRQFKREKVIVLGANYITQADDPGSFWDSIIIRGEVSWTPDKRLTNDLSLFFTEKDDVVSALIFEKYHRISEAFPATYMVFQWMHRTATDMFGRDLSKNGAPDITEFINPVTGAFTPAALVPGAMTPDGNSSANYVVFAFQQPFPNLIWRFDMSILVDVAGGYLVQPGVRYRPAANWQWDLYGTVIESPGGDNDTITETLDFADEVFVRLTYFC